ncbi:MAG: hypothetical protein JST54_04675 [Deltaproteobacteria bacterium]|nr:hypothetical protein [Deltaproteobacteria bacterium]
MAGAWTIRDSIMTPDDPFSSDALPKRSRNFRRVLEWIKESGVTAVTARDLSQLFGEPFDHAPSRGIANRLVERGLLQRLAPGRYVVIRAGESPRAPLDPGERLDCWVRHHAFAHGTAMALHGFGPPLDPEQPLQVFVGTDQPRMPRSLKLDLDFQMRAPAFFPGFVRLEHPALGEVSVRSLAQTALDAVAQPTRCGGFSRVAAFVAFALTRCDATEIVEAGANAGGPAARRLGFLLQTAGARAEDLEPLKRLGAPRYVPLDPNGPREGPLDATWRLKLNASLDGALAR